MSAKRIKNRKKNAEPATTVEQWIEVRLLDGVTTSTRYPDDKEIHKLIAEKEEETGRPVDLIYRRFNFVDGVPDEYSWSTKDPVKLQYGGHAIQRLRVDDWIELSKHEAGGHLESSPFHMPRPESRGGCDCEACQNFKQRIEVYGL